jgi:hypothetical protein
MRSARQVSIGARTRVIGHRPLRRESVAGLAERLEKAGGAGAAVDGSLLSDEVAHLGVGYPPTLTSSHD